MRCFASSMFASLICGMLHGQLPGDTLVMSFDASASLVLDSVYPIGCWQVGAPSKPLFTSAHSAPNALVTDTLLPYPENSTCYAEFTLITDEELGYYGRWIEFDQRLDIAPTTHAWVEVQDSWSGQWGRFGSNWADGWINSASMITTAAGHEFLSTGDGWDHVILDSPCIGVMDGGNERWYEPIMRLRFVFTSLGNPQGRDGWMIDDLRAVATLCTGGISESGVSIPRLWPNPASNHVTLDFGNGVRSGVVRIFRFDGVLVEQRPVSGHAQLDLSGFSAGAYLVRVSGPVGGVNSVLMVVH